MIKRVRFKYSNFMVVIAVTVFVVAATGGDLQPPPGEIQPTNRVQISQQNM